MLLYYNLLCCVYWFCNVNELKAGRKPIATFSASMPIIFLPCPYWALSVFAGIYLSIFHTNIPLKWVHKCQWNDVWLHQVGYTILNTLRPRQDGRYFADDIFKCIFFNENGCILIKSSLKYVRKGSIDNNPPLVQIMAWRRSGDKPLSEPMIIILPTHICVTRPQWVKVFMVSPMTKYNAKKNNQTPRWAITRPEVYTS